MSNLKIEEKWHSFNQWAEKAANDFHQLADRRPNQDPWITTAPAYLLNPVVNLSLSLLHVARTLERVAKVVYYSATAVLSSLAVIFRLGMNQDYNRLCAKQWCYLGLNLYSSILSLVFTVCNITEGAHGLIAIKKATKNEAYWIAQQNRLDKELKLIDKMFKEQKASNVELCEA